MIQTLRHIVLAPFSVLYGAVTEIRNFLYNQQWIKSYHPQTPTIVIGNLAAGGTGKTPHTEYFIRQLKDHYQLAFLSRGYKRKTKGFLEADNNAGSASIGDEPMQIYRKFGNRVKVFVGEDRVKAIKRIQEKHPDTDLILLDDAFQHRKVSAGINIVVSAYDDYFTDDFWLPSGNLRESRKSIQRADILIVSKCPADLSDKEKSDMKLKAAKYTKLPVYFSTVSYGQIYSLLEKQTDINTLNKHLQFPGILIIAGIVNPSGMYRFLTDYADRVELMHFSDHHVFSKHDLRQIGRKYRSMPEGTLIITTEKDAARLYDLPWLSNEIKQKIYVLPIETVFLPNEEKPIEQIITDYVEKNRKNG